VKIDVARKPITFEECAERQEVFAPSWELLMEYKHGWISWGQYTQRYLDEMRAGYRADPQSFHRMAQRLDEVEFVCWCGRKRGNDLRCHRFLLRGILERVRKFMTG
jgi:uncharacterized protein YeaO (DUF488 family)